MQNDRVYKELTKIIEDIENTSKKFKQEIKIFIDNGEFDYAQSQMEIVKRLDDFKLKIKDNKQYWIESFDQNTRSRFTVDDIVLPEMEYKGANAVAEYYEDHIIILSGSTVRKNSLFSLSDKIRDMRKKYFDNGILVQTKTNDLLKVTKPIIFKSSSAAAQFVAGCSESGPRRWRIKNNGISLKRWLEKR